MLNNMKSFIFIFPLSFSSMLTGQELPIANIAFRYILDDESDSRIVLNGDKFDLYKANDTRIQVEVIKSIDRITVVDVITYFTYVKTTTFINELKIGEEFAEMMLIAHTAKQTFRIDFNNGDEWLSYIPYEQMNMELGM